MYKIELLKKAFKSDESKFAISVGLKVVAIFIFVSLLAAYMVWLLLSINNIFFETIGSFVLQDFRQAYFDYVLLTTLEYGMYYFVFLIILFFMGLALGLLITRPFKKIGQFCEQKLNGETIAYYPDGFSNYRLLAHFSTFFFEHLRQCEEQKKIVKTTVHPEYQKIKKPILEKTFFYHFFLYAILIASIGSVLLTFAIYEIQESILELALEFTKASSNKSMLYFLRHQEEIYTTLTYTSTIILLLSYSILAFNLYREVRDAIFAFFVTMRSFMSGNSDARVHLIGHKHIRPFSRSFNKYLDKIEKEYKE